MALFKKTSLQSITSDLTNKIAELKALALGNEDDAAANEVQIRELQQTNTDLRAEASKANRIAGRIEELLA